MKKLIFALTVIFMTGCGTATKAQSQIEGLAKSLYAIEQDDDEKAMEYLSDLLSDFPDYADALYLRARLNYEKDDNAQAIADCTAAIKTYKKGGKYPLSEIYHLRAVTYQYIEDYIMALTDYNSALSLNKNDLNLLGNRANLYFLMDNYMASDNDYNTILSIEPANTYALVGLARNLINQDKPADAIKILERTVKLNPEYGAPYKFLARAYDALGEPRKAIDNAILLLTCDDDYENAYFINEFAPKAYRYAILKLSSTIKEHEENGMWLYVRGMVYQAGRDFSKAISDYQTLNTRFGDSDMIMCSIGNCYDELGDYSQAIEYYTKAIEIDSSYADYYIYRGESRRRMGQLSEALEDYSQTIELNPMSNHGYEQRGWVKEMIGDYEGALGDLDMAIEIESDDAYAYLHRARAYQFLGRDTEAEQDLEKIIVLDTIPSNHSCRQYALIDLGQPEEGVEWMKKIVEQDKDEPGNYYDLACVYARLNRKEEAIEALRQAFEHGYRSFGHIAQDDDMDNIREEAEFRDLIDEFESKLIAPIEQDEESTSLIEDFQTSVVQMKNRGLGTYEVPCSINDLPLTFIFDTGASTVTISSLEASFMLKNNYLNKSDILNREYYVTASGAIEEGTRIRLKNVKIGDFSLENVEATVVTNQSAPLLLGQSVLNRFGKVDIDYHNMKITLKK
jgi:clan AA aspartic protease (TIGR02281 family)